MEKVKNLKECPTLFYMILDVGFLNESGVRGAPQLVSFLQCRRRSRHVFPRCVGLICALAMLVSYNGMKRVKFGVLWWHWYFF